MSRSSSRRPETRALLEELEKRKASTSSESAWTLSWKWVGSVSDATLPPGALVREELEEWNPDRR